MADIIKLLPDHVANQIAAGEVVQRPASVVKELLENAIDAQASEIKLIIKNSGKTLIQVIDNGVGMSDTDARFSFERHATSKISVAKDLFQLSTKGFRGEALASIVAIAQVEMHTRVASNNVGTLLKIEGSKIISQEASAVPKGTSVAVKNLFFNIPARRKFLKSDAVELRHIIDEFHRIALAHPEIHMKMYNNDNEFFNLTSSNYRKRIVDIFGKKTNAKLVPIKEETTLVKVNGFVYKPNFAKRSRGEQFFFVNHRFIKSPYLHHSVVEAFKGLIKEQTRPGYFIYLTIDPANLDINIHPTKTEVKFENEHTLYTFLKSAVKHSLGQFHVVPMLDFEANPNLNLPYAYKNKAATVPHIEVDKSFNPFTKEEHKGTKKSVSIPVPKSSPSHWEGIYEGLKEENAKIESDFESIPFEDTANQTLFKEKENKVTASTSFQLKRKYIVSPIKSGIIVIDQGRAHQRILYEKFLKDIKTEKTSGQQLLFPLQLVLNTTDIALLLEIKDNLEQAGFGFSDIKEDTLYISKIPFLINEKEVQSLIEQLIDKVKIDIKESHFSQKELLAKTLCKSLAVKSGTVLNTEEQGVLINDLFACTEPKISPFNQPIYITTLVEEWNKKFMQ